MQLVLNGQTREFPSLTDPAHLGNIVPRGEWETTGLHEGDRLEIVHFVGGGKS